MDAEITNKEEPDEKRGRSQPHGSTAEGPILLSSRRENRLIAPESLPCQIPLGSAEEQTKRESVGTRVIGERWNWLEEREAVVARFVEEEPQRGSYPP